MDFEKAPDVQEIINDVVLKLDLKHIDIARVVGMRSWGSTSNAIARIWEYPRIWHEALGIPPAYVIEVISKRYDKQNPEDKLKTIIHEILHIPKTFSGALVPHRCFGKMQVGHKNVNKLYKQYKETKLATEQDDGLITMD